MAMTTDVREMGSYERELDGEPHTWINASGLPDEQVLPNVREVAYTLSRWVTEQRAVRGTVSLFDRRGYVVSDNPFAQMLVARKAIAEDDIVSGTAEVTEGLIFQGVKMECEDPDDADVFNQIARDINLDAVIRSAYREMFTYSQAVFASWWGWKDYTVRGYTAPPKQKLVPAKTAGPDGQETVAIGQFEPERDPENNQPIDRPRKGNKRRKKYHVWVPTRISILDSSKVIPVGNSLWGLDRLAWHATKEEMEMWDGLYMGTVSDATMTTLILGKYTPGKDEEKELMALGVDPTKLLELNPDYVWRHTATRSAYEKWPQNRMKSVFRLLDLKQQLMDSDRANLVGAANYIILVKKGSEKEPAKQEELTNLKEGMSIVARMPVIISDHRLEIEIITPKLDLTLSAEKYDTIDRRIISRLLGALTIASSGQRNETTVTIGRMVARLLESKRHMIKRTLEEKVIRATVDHPLNKDKFEEEPNLAYTPRNVQLDSDAQIVQAVLALSAKKDLSRESTLEYFGFDQAVEAQRKEFEAEVFDPIFQTAVPFDSPMNGGGMPPGAFGAQGGRPMGGGAPPANAAKPTPAGGSK